MTRTTSEISMLINILNYEFKLFNYTNLMYFSIKMLNLRPSHLKNIFYLYIIYQSFSMVPEHYCRILFSLKISHFTQISKI